MWECLQPVFRGGSGCVDRWFTGAVEQLPFARLGLERLDDARVKRVERLLGRRSVAVVSGRLTERVVAAGPGRPPRQSTADLTAGRVRSFGPHYVHQVVNTVSEPAVSVHVYTPQLRLMNTYRIDPQALVRTGTERAGVDW